MKFKKFTRFLSSYFALRVTECWVENEEILEAHSRPQHFKFLKLFSTFLSTLFFRYKPHTFVKLRLIKRF